MTGRDADALDGRLRRLISLAETADNGNSDDVDWCQSPALPFWLPRRMAGWAISQFRHGEVATARTCRQLAGRIGNPEASRLLYMQARDENRHAGLYDRYLDRINCTLCETDVLAPAWEAIGQWDGPDEAIMLAVHVVIEGEGLRLQQDAARWLPCPLFRQLSTAIARDEGRHVAFGKAWLRGSLRDLGAGEHERMHDWLRGLWWLVAGRLTARLDPFDLVNGPQSWQGWMDTAWRQRETELASLGLRCVSPAKVTA